MDKTITIRSVFAIMVSCMFLGIGVSAFIMSVCTSLFPDVTARFITLFSIFIGQGTMVLPALLFVKKNNYSYNQTFRIKSIPIQFIYPIVFFSLGAVIISDEIDKIINMFFSLDSYIEDVTGFVEFNSPVYTVILILATVVIAPFSEEILFRGFLQKFLENYWKDITKAVLVTSLFFAFVHMNPAWIIQIYFMGILLGYLAWKTDSILPGFVLHAINNGTSLVFQNFGEIFEGVYIWNNHVSPFFLFLGGYLFLRGYKAINSFGNKI